MSANFNFILKRITASFPEVKTEEVSTLSEELEYFYSSSIAANLTMDSTKVICKLCGRQYDAEEGEICPLCKEIKRKIEVGKTNKSNKLGAKPKWLPN